MSLLTKTRDRDRGDREMIGHTIGNALVVRPRNVLRDEIRDLALNLAADPDHELVVVDVPAETSFSLWESAAKLMPRKRRGLRLVIGGRSRETAVLAGQWFAERLGRTVIAPDGLIMPGVGGSLFVDAGWGTGWVRFRPGKSPQLDGKRFPRPTWENVSSLVEVMPTSAGGVTEPLPGGAWLRPRGPESVLRAHRTWLIGTLPCQPDVCTVVLGCPGAPPISLYDITRFWSWLPAEVRGKVRLVRFGQLTLPGDVAYGQAIADAVGERVVCYTGMPFGSRTQPAVFTLCQDGALGWQAFAEEVSYCPADPASPASPPALVSYHAPAFGFDEIAPAVYQYAQDVVLEVVPAGLWLRPPYEVGHAAEIRSAEPDGARHLVVFEEGTDEASLRLRELAEDVIGRLDPPTRDRSDLAPARSVVRRRIEVAGQAMGAIEQGAAFGTPFPALPAPQPGVPVAREADAGESEVPVAVEAPVFVESMTVRIERPSPETATAISSVSPTPVMPSLVAEAHTPDGPIAAKLGGARAVEVPVEVPALGVPAVDVSAVDVSAVEVPAVDVPVVDLPVGEAAAGAAGAAPQGTTPVPPPTPPVPSPPVAAVPAPPAAPVLTAENIGHAPVVPERAGIVTILQPTPETAAAALVPKRGLDEERAWLRRTLSREYAAVANSVSRVLSEHPGFQGALERSSGSVLTDAVAIRLYLSPEGDGMDLPLRMGAVGPHVPFARCVVSGLGRLPSHRGATMYSASLTEQEWELYRSRKLVTEWGFVHALSTPCARQFQQNDVDVLIWSMTARRTKLLEPEAAPAADRVLFVPGTSFKVLDLSEPADGERGHVLLRELAAGEIDPSGRVDRNRASLDELAVNSLRRCLQTWESAKKETRVPASALARFGSLPGLVRKDGR